MLSVPITKNRDRREAMRLTKKLKYPETWYLFDSIHWRFDRFCCYFLFVRSFVVVMLPFSASRWQCQCINKCVGGINPPGLQSYAITFSVLFSLHFFLVEMSIPFAPLLLWDCGIFMSHTQSSRANSHSYTKLEWEMEIERVIWVSNAL